jgi:mannan endo-1,4-beta-mannosidase
VVRAAAPTSHEGAQRTGLVERRRQVTVPRTVVLLLILVLPGYVLWGAPNLNLAAQRAAAHAVPDGSTPATASLVASTPTASAPPVVFPPDDKVFLGISVPETSPDMADIDRFTAKTNYTPRVVLFTRAWANDRFDAEPFNRVAARGALPMLSWEPWDYRLQLTKDAREAGYQPAYRLSSITSGEFDAYISSYARGIKSLGYPVAIRFGHEMNGFWYPWCEQTNGNRTGDYVEAYRHVHDLFTEAGADNAIWVWSPNVTYAGSSPLSALYPGDTYVDWLGLSGYYGINSPAYVSFENTFNRSTAELRALARKPIVLTEIGATDAAGRKAEWVSDMFRALTRQPDIIGVIWFEVAKETDWRISSSAAASTAFSIGAGHPRYDVRWTLASVPRRIVPSPIPSPASSSSSRRS